MNDQNRYRGNSPQRNQNDERGSSWNRQQESSLLDRGNSPRGRSGTGGDLSSRSGFGDDFDDERSFREQDREYRGGSSGYGRNRDYQNESSGFGAQGSYYGDRDRDPSSGAFSGRSSSTYSRGGGYGSSGYGGASSRAGMGDESGWSSPSQSSLTSRQYRGGGSDRGWNTNYPSSTSGTGYAGRGPKGYTRSDERIREDVCERLSEDDLVDASDIEVRVSDRKVTLTGSVENRRMKHVAEDIAEAVSGVDDVDNQVTVRKPFLKDMADRISGNDADQHHANSGTKNSPASGTSGTSQNASARS